MSQTIKNIVGFVEGKWREVDDSQAGCHKIPAQLQEIRQLLGLIVFQEVKLEDREEVLKDLIALREKFEFYINGLEFHERTTRTVTATVPNVSK